MTLEQLRIFLATAERQHVRKAAEALGLTQSAVSAAITALEQRHDVQLFHRVGRGIELTEAGCLFLAEARAVLARASAATAVLDELSGLKRGALRVVASQTLGGYWLPRHLAAFHAAYPGISVEMTIANTAQAAALVQEGAAELGFVEGAVDEPTLFAKEVARDAMTLVSARPAAHVDAAFLQQAAWVMREAGSGTRGVLEKALAEAGVDVAALTVALALPSNEAVRSAVMAGAGITALSAEVVAAGIVAGTLHALPFALPTRPFFALSHRERYRSRAADALIALIEAAHG